MIVNHKYSSISLKISNLVYKSVMKLDIFGNTLKKNTLIS